MLKYGIIYKKRGGLIVKKSILFIILGLVIITGCSERNVKKEDSLVEDKTVQDTIEIPEESAKEDVIEVKEELGQPSNEDIPTVENTNSNENQQHSTTITNDGNTSTDTTEGKIDRDNPFTNAVAFDNMLYYDFISADHFETKHYLSPGDEIELIENEKGDYEHNDHPVRFGDVRRMRTVFGTKRRKCSDRCNKGRKTRASTGGSGGRRYAGKWRAGI